ncbi:hypothetical protein NKI19_09395 [Mesorhizobium sp. M0751]|uniref:hypothetical protein n=1 Tax=unclassified Mesorhizobium TaxID=325217 RepID=UPI00333A4176
MLLEERHCPREQAFRAACGEWRWQSGTTNLTPSQMAAHAVGKRDARPEDRAVRR